MCLQVYVVMLSSPNVFKPKKTLIKVNSCWQLICSFLVCGSLWYAPMHVRIPDTMANVTYRGMRKGKWSEVWSLIGNSNWTRFSSSGLHFTKKQLKLNKIFFFRPTFYKKNPECLFWKPQKYIMFANAMVLMVVGCAWEWTSKLKNLVTIVEWLWVYTVWWWSSSVSK